MRFILEYAREGRNYLITLLVLAVMVLGLLFYLGAPVGGSTSPVMVIVPQGATAAKVGCKLKEVGLVRSAFGFSVIARAREDASKLKPGAYLFNRSMSVRRMLDAMVHGDIAAVWVTVPEGFTAQQLARRLADKRLVNENEFLTLVTACAGDFKDIVSVPSSGLEGYLFPDTYLVPLNASPREIVTQMLKTFKSQVADPMSSEIEQIAGGSDAESKGEALNRIIIVASLIEREARVPKDRTLISAVIWNRLRIGMKLDIDATVQYALGGHRKRLYYKDLAVESPYNTYIHPGLPPGPIANPGIESIKAALHPEKADYLYYVARTDGSHIFSRTLSEHDAAINRLRKGGRP
ncbi:MAG: endolytic transglycosylase MltG [Armatimonadota bacterium]